MSGKCALIAVFGVIFWCQSALAQPDTSDNFNDPNWGCNQGACNQNYNNNVSDTTVDSSAWMHANASLEVAGATGSSTVNGGSGWTFNQGQWSATFSPGQVPSLEPSFSDQLAALKNSALQALSSVQAVATSAVSSAVQLATMPFTLGQVQSSDPSVSNQFSALQSKVVAGIQSDPGAALVTAGSVVLEAGELAVAVAEPAAAETVLAEPMAVEAQFPVQTLVIDVVANPLVDTGYKSMQSAITGAPPVDNSWSGIVVAAISQAGEVADGSGLTQTSIVLKGTSLGMDASSSVNDIAEQGTNSDVSLLPAPDLPSSALGATIGSSPSSNTALSSPFTSVNPGGVIIDPPFVGDPSTIISQGDSGTGFQISSQLVGNSDPSGPTFSGSTVIESEPAFSNTRSGGGMLQNRGALLQNLGTALTIGSQVLQVVAAAKGQPVPVAQPKTSLAAPPISSEQRAAIQLVKTLKTDGVIKAPSAQGAPPAAQPSNPTGNVTCSVGLVYANVVSCVGNPNFPH